MAPPRLGELLVAEGLLPSSAVDRALGFQKAAAPRVKLGSILMTWDLIDETSLLKTLAALHRCEPVSGDTLAQAPVDVVRMMPASHAIRLDAIPYAREKSRLRVAFVNPSDLAAIDETSAVTGHVCVPGVATELRLLQAHRRFYGRPLPPELRPTLGRVDASRASRASRAAVPVSRPWAEVAVAIPVQPERSFRAEAEASPISIPEIPLLSAPPAAPPETAVPPTAEASGTPAEAPPGTEPPAPDKEHEPAPMWMTTPREMPPPSDAVLGMWSPAATPPALSHEEMGDIALSHVPPEFARVLLLSARRDALAGWRARGLDAAGVAALELFDASPSVFGAVRLSGAPHFGRVDPEMWPQALGRLLDGPPPCAVFPVHSARGIAAVLYADRRGAPMKFEDTALLARAAADIATLLALESPTRSAPTA